MNYYLKQDFFNELRKSKKEDLINIINDLFSHYDDDFISNYIIEFLNEN